MGSSFSEWYKKQDKHSKKAAFGELHHGAGHVFLDDELRHLHRHLLPLKLLQCLQNAFMTTMWSMFLENASIYNVYSCVYIHICTWIFERTQIIVRLQDFWRSWKWLLWSILDLIWFNLYLLGWSYSTLRKNVSVFLGGNSREKVVNTREKCGNTRANSSWLKNENMKEVVFFSWNDHFYFEMGKSTENW